MSYLYSYIYTCSIYNNLDMISNQMSINWWVDKENAVHISYGILINKTYTNRDHNIQRNMPEPPYLRQRKQKEK